MATVQVRGVKIVYEVLGDRGPWLALTSGGRHDHTEMVPLARKIAAMGCRVLLHDRRNTGASEILIEGDDQEEIIWADDLYELLSLLGASPAFLSGSSSGARLSMRTYLRHRDAVAGLVLLRVTGGAYAAERLPESYYRQFIRAAEQGGMAAVCETEQYRERLAKNPAMRERLLAMDPAHYLAVMNHWLDLFLPGMDLPVTGVTPEELNSITVPTIIIPGNDNVHSSKSGLAAHRLIPGSELHRLPIEDQDVPLIMMPEWAAYEDEIARVAVDFMHRHPAHK